ncbi:hypothetical protein PUNSTDRAFT_134495 [Punctularia strigosozonata HHB-11173 SS5]|uniref:uncharacterized protein n=1 Tax=Punctularia strigosozonata (strain HHB-11173) TaxID=741275 RepID=UPI000441811E|nr:uncharacterized protein PUNSTDRAFT_134495 [Punctularia strigosozonata HHB-11173 SS5]EIN09342.1 hypothetical protein PUNSTDRAFT_134495 [Punctularia strigosozonata HHB-11173 SS5]
MPKAPKEAFYAVRRGVKQGVYASWDEAKKYVLGCPDARYKKFKTREEAHAFAFPTQSTPTTRVAIKREASTQALTSTPSASQVPKVVFYGVQKGRQQGVFESWDEVQKQVRSYPDAKHRCFCTRQEAEEYVAGTWQSQPTDRWSDTPTQCVKTEASGTNPLASEEEDSDFDFNVGFGDDTNSDSDVATPPTSPSSRTHHSTTNSNADSDSDSDIEILPDVKPHIVKPHRTAAVTTAAKNARFLAIKQELDGPPLSQVQQYFKDLPESQSVPKHSYIEAFYDLSRQQRWDKVRFKAERWKFQSAYGRDFDQRYGTDPNSLHSWQQLCRAIGIHQDEMPTDLWSCRELVHNTHVNIYDLVDQEDLDTPVQQFATVSDLSDYCYNENKFFPLDVAKRDTLLQHLLREVA